MAVNRFDDLVLALQWAFICGREELRKRHEEALIRILEGNKKGEPHSPYFVFSLPRPGKDTDEYETVTLPLSSFRDRRRPRISMLSMEFECEFKEKTLPGPSMEKGMVMKIRRKTGARRKHWRRVRIVFQSEDHSSGEVRVDGELLMEVPPFTGPVARGTSAEVKRSFFRVLLNYWRRLWRRQEFVLSKQQAIRIREIAVHSDHEASEGEYQQDIEDAIYARRKGGPGCT